MLNKQEHINDALHLAEKGLYHKDSIKEVIKADFYNQNNGRISVMDLRNKLSRKYGVSLQTIYNITNG
jgi:Mor family transcriptional regulator